MLWVVRRLGEVWQRAREALDKDRTEGYRELVRILLLHQEYPSEEVALALEETLSLGVPTASVVRQLILNRQPQRLPVVAIPEGLTGFVVRPADLARYDVLARRVG